MTWPGQGDAELSIADALLALREVEWLTPAALPREPLPRWKPAQDGLEPRLLRPEVAVPFGTPGEGGRWLEADGPRWRLHADLLGAAFFWLTRYEELARPRADAHDRFPGAASLAAREGLLTVPVVDEWAALIGACLARLWPGLPRRPRRPRVVPSHDVDRVRWVAGHPFHRVARSLGADLLRRRDPALAGARLRSWWRCRRRGDAEADLANRFDLIMDVSERHGLVSQLNFIAGRTAPAYDGDYELDEPGIRALLRRIHARGHEIGLHPSYATYLDPSRVAAEWAALQRACVAEGVEQESFGGRQHYLRWRNPATWRAWEGAGLAWDSSLGFADRSGFRCGTSRSYPAFDLERRRPLALRERPLVAMDATLLGYEGLDWDAAAERALALAAACHHHGGDFTLLVHNTTLASPRARRWYEELVAAATAQMRRAGTGARA